MEKLYKIYAVSSILLLIVLAAFPLKYSFRGWRRFQKEYNSIIKKLPQNEKLAARGLQQIWIRDLGRTDRCPTCHPGADTSKLKDLPLPFRPHSKIYHDINKFGCTICHEGQGLATKYSDAHLPSESWDQPILPNRYIESSCGRCHINEDLIETPDLNRGRKLVRGFKCFSCHELPVDFNSFTPTLEGIASKVVNKDWLARWLKNPQAIRPNTKMPNFVLSNEEIGILSEFLMRFKNFPGDMNLDPLPDFYSRRKNNADFIELGKTIFRESPCISCHAVDGDGGKLATDLAKAGSKVKENWLFNFIKDPQRLQPGIEMPQFGFSNEQASAITAYLSSEFIDWDSSVEEDSKYQSRPDIYDRGKAIFYRYNCTGCHQLPGLKLVENRGPDLSKIGSKKIYQIWFGETTIPQTLYSYLETKLKTPRIFGESMRMPDFHLSDKDRQAITTYLLSLRDENLPQEFMTGTAMQPEFILQGRAGKIVHKYSCMKCHSINDTGGDIAPDLSIVGSRLRQEWTRQFLKHPISRRPLVEERMLNFFMADDEIETLINYFYTVLLDDSLSIAADWKPTAEARERGKRLYWEKYGCHSCHSVIGEGGYLGPPLDNVSVRLQTEWIFNWILNPQKYIPDTIEPRSGMSISEALDLVAYLMSL